MGITQPAEERDETIEFTGTTKEAHALPKKLIVRDGRLVGSILMGDISKAAYLMQCFDRDAPLPDEPAMAPVRSRRADPESDDQRNAAEMQVCHCNGVSKAAIAAALHPASAAPRP